MWSLPTSETVEPKFVRRRLGSSEVGPRRAKSPDTKEVEIVETYEGRPEAGWRYVSSIPTSRKVACNSPRRVALDVTILPGLCWGAPWEVVDGEEEEEEGGGGGGANINAVRARRTALAVGRQSTSPYGSGW